MDKKGFNLLQVLAIICLVVGFIIFSMAGMFFNFALVSVGFILFFIGMVLSAVSNMGKIKNDIDKNKTIVRELFDKTIKETENKTKCEYCGTMYEGETCYNCGAKKQ